MATLKETAKAYVPKQTKNIAELPKFSAELEVMEKKGKDKKGKDFLYNVIEINGEEYRVPDSVLKGMKAILEKLPNTKEFTVLKTGEGINSEYQVIPFTAQ